MKPHDSFFDKDGLFHLPTVLIRERRSYGLSMREMEILCLLKAKHKPTNFHEILDSVSGSRTTKWRVMRKLKEKGYL